MKLTKNTATKTGNRAAKDKSTLKKLPLAAATAFEVVVTSLVLTANEFAVELGSFIVELRSPVVDADVDTASASV
jgi:hypothetical protein